MRAASRGLRAGHRPPRPARSTWRPGPSAGRWAPAAREDLVARALAELADALPAGDDPFGFLRRDWPSGACRCSGGRGRMVLAGAQEQLLARGSSERMHLIEVQCQDGPCLDCWRSASRSTSCSRR